MKTWKLFFYEKKNSVKLKTDNVSLQSDTS